MTFHSNFTFLDQYLTAKCCLKCHKMFENSIFSVWVTCEPCLFIYKFFFRWNFQFIRFADESKLAQIWFQFIIFKFNLEFRTDFYSIFFLYFISILFSNFFKSYKRHKIWIENHQDAWTKVFILSFEAFQSPYFTKKIESIDSWLKQTWFNILIKFLSKTSLWAESLAYFEPIFFYPSFYFLG